MTTTPRPPAVVLLVEDSPRDAELIRRELTKSLGAVTTEVIETPEAFSAALRRTEWDVVIADHSLPRFSSTDALRILQESGRDIPFVIVSGSMGEELAVKAMKAGASDFITKANLARLGPAVARELHDAEVRRKLAESERRRERRELERELMRRQLDVLRRMGNDIQILIEPDGTIMQVNDRALSAYGYSEGELLGLNIRDLREPGTVPDLEETLQQTLATDGRRYTTLHRRRDGSTFPVEVSIRLLEIETVRLIHGIVRDLTAERAARAAIDHQAMLLDNLHDAVIGLDGDMVINAWNHAAERLFGWTGAETLGRVLEETVPSECPTGASLEEMCRMAPEGRATSEVRRRTRGGDWLDLECTSVALRSPDGVLRGYVSVNRDITLRKRAESALRASQEQLRRILETVNEGIWVADVQGRTQFVNARAAELFGFDVGEAVGRSILDLVPDHLRPTVRADLDALARGEAIQRELTLGGAAAPTCVVLSTSVLRDGDGSVAGAVAVFMDVTAHHRGQERFLQAQKMEAVGRLASGIAHDFNNLLVVILSNAGFLLESLPEGDERRADAEGIREAGQRAERLVRQILTFSRKELPRPVPLKLESVVRGVEKLLRRTIGEDVAVSTSFEPGPCHTRIDPGHLEQVLMNLAVNARDAMPEGGTLRIACRCEDVVAPPAGCLALPARRYAVLEMSDTGCGMSAEVASKVFEPFFTTKERDRGTGLGLSTVFGIVEQARGGIALSSEIGRGTTFTIYLPACDAAEPQERADAPAALARGHGEIILVAEDEDAVRDVTRRMLERRGFRVVEARNATEALSHVESGAPVDVLVTDVVMPGGSGPALAARAGELRPDLPVVLVSGYSDRQPGAWGAVLAKPFDEEALVSTVLRALRDRVRADGSHGG